jgi:hypothetical protein
LTSLCWTDAELDLYPQRWTLRSAPRAYHVSPGFPALTSASLNTLGWAPNEITQLRYEVDVTHRPADFPSDPLATAIQHLK